MEDASDTRKPSGVGIFWLRFRMDCYTGMGDMDGIIAFLICALSIPSTNFTHPAIVSYHAAKSEQESLEDFLHKNNPGAEIFIHPKPQKDKLKEVGFERVPFTWRGNEIWIKRKPKGVMSTSA